MRMDKLTAKFQEAIGDAQSLALKNKHNYMEAVHLLKALLEQKNGTISNLLTSAGANTSALMTKLTVKLNNAGFRLGQHVRIKYHNANSFWQRNYRPSELVGERGYIVGCTPCYVHVAMGNLWSAYVNIIRKKNECVARCQSKSIVF